MTRVTWIDSDEVNTKLVKACEVGDYDLAVAMLKRGATNVNSGLANSCYINHPDLISLMIKNGATDWNQGLRMASLGGHYDIVCSMIERGANDWNNALHFAMINGNKNITGLLLERGANSWTNWDKMLINTYCRHNNQLALTMITKGMNIDDYDFRLSKDDIMYLIKSGCQRFGRYQSMSDECRRELKTIHSMVDDVIEVPDVSALICDF